MVRRIPGPPARGTGRPHRAIVAALWIALSACAGAVRADVTWDGDTDVYFTNGNNWVSSAAPADDTSTDVAIFSGALPTYQPILDAARKVKGIRFDSAGWHLFNWATMSAAYELELGSYGIYDNSSYGSASYVGSNAVLKVTGPTDVKYQGQLYVYSKITGSGGLVFDGLTDNNNQGWVYLYGNNDFTGDVTFNDAVSWKGSYVSVRHNSALGAKPNLVVRVVDQSGYQSSGAARLALESPATAFAANVAEIIIEGEATYPAQFSQGRGTTVGTKITLEGGTYIMSAAGSGDRYNTAEIALKTGTTSTLSKDDSSSGNNNWYQQGQITGGGSLRIVGNNSYDETFRFEGNNTYSGGTYVEKQGNENEMYVHHNNALGSGPVELQSDADNKSAFALSANLTMPNAFRGRGKISTGAFLLTTTGSIEPRDTGLAAVTKNVGTIYFEDLKFGSDSQGCTYTWQYNDTTNDVVACDTLAFGNAVHALNVEWLGTGAAPTGTYTLFTYAGADPSVGDFIVHAPAGLRGDVSVDTANNKVLITLSPATPAGSVFRLR